MQSAAAQNATAEGKPVTRRGIAVRNTDVLGQVFISSEKPGENELPAKEVQVHVRNLEDDEILQGTVSDDEGYFRLTKLEVGRYWLTVGALRLDLTIESGPDIPGEVPKVVIIVIPREMAKSKPGRPHPL